MNRKITFIILVILILLLTMLAIAREYTFVWINAAINNANTSSNNSEIPKFFLKFSKLELYQLKWLLSLFFGFFNVSLSILAVYLYFNSRNFALFLFFIYVFCGIVLAAGYLLSKILSVNEQTYSFLHDLLLLLQTPILFIVIFPIFMFYKKNT